MEFGGKLDPNKPFALEADYYRDSSTDNVHHGIAPFFGGEEDRLAMAGKAPNWHENPEGLVFAERLNRDEQQTQLAATFQAGSWTTWRVEVFPGRGELKFYAGGQLLDSVSPRNPVLRAQEFGLFSAREPVESANVCWSKLKLFERP